MKQLGSISKEKFASLEEGLIPEARIFTQGARSASNNKSCKQVAQCVKIILYLLFVGLACYAMWQTFSINTMEFKVINSIRESQPEGLFGQRSTFDKSGGQFHHFKDISTTEALDRKTNETDDDESFDTPDVITESHGIYENYNEEVVGTTASTDEAEEIIFTRTTTTTTTTTESPVESVESNSSPAQQMNDRFYDNYDEDYLVSDEMKLEPDQEEIFENYALLSLIIQNAVRTSQIVDSFVHYDNSDNWGDSAALSPQNGNGVEEENSQGTRETQETQETLKLFINEGDYEEEISENSDYQTETVMESTAENYYGEFYGRPYGLWRIYV